MLKDTVNHLDLKLSSPTFRTHTLLIFRSFSRLSDLEATFILWMFYEHDPRRPGTVCDKGIQDVTAAST